jgi:hypothetical protein
VAVVVEVAVVVVVVVAVLQNPHIPGHSCVYHA